jgi:hypothetical protein
MNDLISKISSYNLFNYFFPGVVFSVIVSNVSQLNLIQDDLLTGAFLYYFIGMIISRVGSLIIEPTLKKIRVVKFSDYGDFIQASQKDEKIELLSEVNNTYRTLISMFILLLFTKGYLCILSFFEIDNLYNWVFLIIFLLALFLFSYRKQTSHINKRIGKQINGI